MHRELAKEIHAANVAAGWWDMGIENRNRGEVMMLIVSELAEAAEGIDSDAADDKLPHLPMFDVELADTAIRLYDLIGADAAEHPFDWEKQVDLFCGEMHCADEVRDLMLIVRAVARAMEGHRKGRGVVYAHNLWVALAGVYAVAETYDTEDLDDVIRQKREFNAVRADHKPENRAKPGGKAY